MPSSSMVFPYGISLRRDALVNIFPAAEVSLRSHSGEWLTLFFVIDSGATLSVLPESDAIALGINADEGESVAVRGIDGKLLHGRRHELSGRIGRERLQFPAVLLKDDAAPRVLGREGIFNHFTIVFEEHKRRSGFLKANTRPALKVSKTLDDEYKSTRKD